jgi:atypical dual specificity phosphatase
MKHFGAKEVIEDATRRGLDVTGLLVRTFTGLFVVGCSAYFLCQKRMLNEDTTRIVSRIFFWPTIPITYLSSLRRGKYFTPIDDTLLLGGAPLAILGHPEELREIGVRGVINMCGEYSGPRYAYDKLGIQQLRLPTTDHFEPSLDAVIEAVKFIDRHRKEGGKVLVHCKGGHGRSAAVALCWLATMNPESPLKALNSELLDRRHVRKTLFQQKTVTSFARYMAKKNIAGGVEGKE